MLGSSSARSRHSLLSLRDQYIRRVLEISCAIVPECSFLSLCSQYIHHFLEISCASVQEVLGSFRESHGVSGFVMHKESSFEFGDDGDAAATNGLDASTPFADRSRWCIQALPRVTHSFRVPLPVAHPSSREQLQKHTRWRYSACKLKNETIREHNNKSTRKRSCKLDSVIQLRCSGWRRSRMLGKLPRVTRRRLLRFRVRRCCRYGCGCHLMV